MRWLLALCLVGFALFPAQTQAATKSLNQRQLVQMFERDAVVSVMTYDILSQTGDLGQLGAPVDCAQAASFYGSQATSQGKALEALPLTGVYAKTVLPLMTADMFVAEAWLNLRDNGCSEFPNDLMQKALLDVQQAEKIVPGS